MYVELGFLFLIYCFATIALAVSVYALWTLEELKQYYKQKKPTNTYKPPQPTITKRPKGHWD